MSSLTAEAIQIPIVEREVGAWCEHHAFAAEDVFLESGSVLAKGTQVLVEMELCGKCGIRWTDREGIHVMEIDRSKLALVKAS